MKQIALVWLSIAATAGAPPAGSKSPLHLEERLTRSGIAPMEGLLQVGPDVILVAEIYQPARVSELLDLNTHALFKVPIPVEAIVGAHPELLFDASEQMSNEPVGQRVAERLVRYDRKLRRAGAIVQSHSSSGGKYRSLNAVYAEWNLVDGSVSAVVPLATLGDERYLRVLGLHPDGDALFYFLEQRTPAPKSGPGWMQRSLTLYRLDLATYRNLSLQTFQFAPRSESPWVSIGHLEPFFSSDFKHFAFAEYAEAGGSEWQTSPPLLQVLDLSTDHPTLFTLTAPLTCYGGAFDSKGRYLYLGSNQAKRLYRIDLARQKADREVPGPEHIQRFSISRDGKRLHIWSSGSDFHVVPLPEMSELRNVHYQDSLPDADWLSPGQDVVSWDGRFAVLTGPNSAINDVYLVAIEP